MMAAVAKNVPFVSWQKIELKKVLWEKIKNTEESVMNVGLLAVCLQDGLYVFGQLSTIINTMPFYIFTRLSVGVVSSYHWLERFAALRCGRLDALTCLNSHCLLIAPLFIFPLPPP